VLGRTPDQIRWSVGLCPLVRLEPHSPERAACEHALPLAGMALVRSSPSSPARIARIRAAGGSPPEARRAKGGAPGQTRTDTPCGNGF